MWLVKADTSQEASTSISKSSSWISFFTNKGQSFLLVKNRAFSNINCWRIKFVTAFLLKIKIKNRMTEKLEKMLKNSKKIVDKIQE